MVGFLEATMPTETAARPPLTILSEDEALFREVA